MRYFALDFETGNASPLSACALGVSIFEDGRLVGEHVSLLKPPACAGKFHWGNVRVNHIKENMVQDAPSFASFWRELAPLAEGSVLVAHNAMFDTGAPDAAVLADTIGMRMGRISSMGKTPCSIAKNTIEKRRTRAKRNL